MMRQQAIATAVALALLNVVTPPCAATLVEGYVVNLRGLIHTGLLERHEYSTSVANGQLAKANSYLALRSAVMGCGIDYPACVRLTSDRGWSPFGTIGDDYDLGAVFASVEHAYTWLDAWADPSGTINNVHVYVAISLAGAPKEGLAIPGDARTLFMVAYDSDADTWAHEFGHTCGLLGLDGSYGVCGENIMREDVVPQLVRDQLTAPQASVIEGALLGASELYDFIYAAAVDCNPTSVAGVEDVLAVAGSGGVTLRFRTAWEEHHQAFQVDRVSPETGATMYTVGAPSLEDPSDVRSYGIGDPSGSAGSAYRIIEHQTEGRPDLSYGVHVALDGQAPSGPQAYDPDSLAAVVITYDDGRGDPTDPPPPPCSNTYWFPIGTPEYEILCPDSFGAALQPYASLWRDRGVRTTVITKTEAVDCKGGYREWIRWAAAHGTTHFLLVGDANDYELFTDSTLWVGWFRPSNLPQPEKDIIPTYYGVVTASERWPYETPYFSTDVPFADVDGDGLPDVIVGRLPASSTAEIYAYTAKLSRWFQGTSGLLGTAPAIFTKAFNHGMVPAWITAFAADSLRAAIPSGLNVTRADAVDWNDATATSDSVYQIVGAAMAGGADLIVWNVNASSSIHNGFITFCPEGYVAAGIPFPETSRPFISVGLSCGLNDFDQTERSGGMGCTQNVARYRPLLDKFLFDPTHGAIAQIGPTRGSFAIANPILGREFIRRLYDQGATVGRAFLLAQRHAMMNYPQYRDPFKSFVLLGDPRLGGTSVTGVAEVASPSHYMSLRRPEPNPFNPSTLLRFFVDRPGHVSLRIFDVHGRVVRKLLEERMQPAGWGEVRWNGTTDFGTSVGSGVYFAQLRAGTSCKTQRLVLLR